MVKEVIQSSIRSAERDKPRNRKAKVKHTQCVSVKLSTNQRKRNHVSGVWIYWVGMDKMASVCQIDRKPQKREGKKSFYVWMKLVFSCSKCQCSDWRHNVHFHQQPLSLSLPFFAAAFFPLSALSPTPVGNWLKQNVTIMPCSSPLQLFIN